MAEARDEKEQQPQKLSDRIENHRKEVQYLIKQGGEQPQYEFKRAVSLDRENLDDRLDFVKLMQAVANAELATERCIVIGADPKEKKFYAVRNSEEFDPANVSKILSAYLDPLPKFQTFNLTTDDNEPLVLIALDANQPRPIIVTKAGQTEKGKARLEVGDIWIKKNTDTARATRADIDLMYKVRSEEEAEDRARKRVKHLLELSPSGQSFRRSVTVPSFPLIVGPRDELRKFAEELIATSDSSRFNMLVELGRETLVEGWDRLSVQEPGSPIDLQQFFAGLDNFYKNQCLPALESMVEVGLLLVKHNAKQEWIETLVDLLMEAFDAPRGISPMQWATLVHPGNSIVPWWRPPFEIYLGIRAIAIYGRAQFFWKERIAAAWGKYFGNATKFLEASSQLEFLLELNSYLGMNTLKDSRLGEWLRANVDSDIKFDYTPDLYAEDLQATVPMAERLYDVVAKGAPFPVYLFVDPRMPMQLFGSLPEVKRRMEVYGGFLLHLKLWQQNYRFQGLRRWPYMWDWRGRLKTMADSALAQQAKGSSG